MTTTHTIPKTVTVETLPVITHQNVRCITTDLLATLYGARSKNIHDNFSNNKDRFEAGKHFFKLEGEPLREFKNLHKPENFGSVEISPRVKELTLWTERGAARHAKMLDTDEAWEVFERLEDAYFGVSDDRPADTLTPSEQQLLAEFVQGKLEGHAAALHGKAIAEIWSRVHRKFRVTRYGQLPRERLREVIAYVQQMPVRALGNEQPKEPAQSASAVAFPDRQRALVTIEQGRITSLLDLSGCSVVSTEGLSVINANLGQLIEQLAWLRGEASGAVLEQRLKPIGLDK